MGIPIRPELPSAFIYFAVFGRNPVFFSKALEYLTLTKVHVLPMCKHIHKEDTHRDRVHKCRRKMAKVTEERLTRIDNVAKDIIATVEIGISSECLTKGESIFRSKDWKIEDEYVREMLSLKDHLVLFPYLLQLDQLLNLKTTCMNLADEVISIMQIKVGITDKTLCLFQNSPAFERYWQVLSERVPEVTKFLTTFRSKIDIVRSSTSQASIVSTVTSGIGSMSSQI